MSINNKPLGQSANAVNENNTGQVLPKLINHNTSEQAFQEGMDDVARQVNQSQIDLGYEDEIPAGVTADPTQGTTGRSSETLLKQQRTVEARLNTLEEAVGVPNNAMGTPLASGVGSIGGPLTSDSMTSADISNTFAAPRINDQAVTTAKIANDAVDDTKIADNAVRNEHIRDGEIVRAKLHTDIQSANVVVGGTTTSTNLGDPINIPIFNRIGDIDGVVEAPAMTEDTTVQVASGEATGDLWVLGSDNDWHQLNNWTVDGALVPSDRIVQTFTVHETTNALTTDQTMPASLTDIRNFLRIAANRLEPDPDNVGMTRRYGLDSGDIINFTDSGRRAGEQNVFTFTYVGDSVGNRIGTDDIPDTDAGRNRFVQLGAVEAYSNGRGLNLGANQFSVQTAIDDDQTFNDNLIVGGNLSVAGTSSFTGTLTTNGVTHLGTVGGQDAVNINGLVNSDVRAAANVDLGTTAAPFTELHVGTVHATTLNGTVRNASFADNDIGINRLDRTNSMGNEAAAGQIPRVATDGNSVDWMDPPIGVERVAALPTDFTNYLVGTLVALTEIDNTDSNNIRVPGTYRSTGTAWERHGVVNMILSKQDIISVADQRPYPTNRIAPAHFITIDGLVLVEGTGNDYTVNSNRMGFTLTAAVAGGKDIVVHNFSDVAALGDGEVATTALAGGTLPSDVFIAGSQVNGDVSTATTATNVAVTGTQDNVAHHIVFTNGSGASTPLELDGGSDFTYNPSDGRATIPIVMTNQVNLGGWTIVESAGGNLDFNRGGNTIMRLTPAGHLHTDGDITAFSTTI